ncbi:putative ceramidase [Helianthus debilis subsp. tardiflorus]
MSPNVLGAFCTDTGLPCDFNHSTCDGKNELCYVRGPGFIFLISIHSNRW